MNFFSKLTLTLIILSSGFSAYAETPAAKPAAKLPPAAVTATPTPDPDKIYREEFLECHQECCSFKKPAIAEAGAVVYDQAIYFKGNKPAELKPVATLKEGQKLTILKMMEFTKPFPFTSKLDQKIGDQAFKKGQTVYVLGYDSEGTRRIWVDGKIVVLDLFNTLDNYPKDKFDAPRIQQVKEYEASGQRWYQVKSEKGNVGWVLSVDGSPTVNPDSSLCGD